MRPEGTSIRPARPEDARWLRGVAEAAYAPYKAMIGRRPAPMDQEFETDIAAGRIWVVEGAGFIVAYDKDGWLLENVAVAQPGGGVGTRLIAFAEDEGRRRGFSRIRLYTNAVMEANIRLYARLGYREVERTRQSGFDRVFFEKAL